MPKIGRPTKLTPTILQKLEEAFALGCTDAEASFYAGIAPATLYNYQEKEPDFLERKMALKSRPVLLARQALMKGIQEDPHLALKFLERAKKGEFGLRQTVTGENREKSAEIVVICKNRVPKRPRRLT